MPYTKNIKRFLACPGNFTDERLAEVYAHCRDGKLSFLSCCCFVGSATADHPLRSETWGFGASHLMQAKSLPFAGKAESEFYRLGGKRFLFWLPPIGGYRAKDGRRRKRVLPLLRAEMDRRDRLRKKQEGVLFFRRLFDLNGSSRQGVSGEVKKV